jgi:uncharacterized protein (DUF427 family)
MPQAIWNGQVLADSDKTKVVEGNHYFPPESINWEFFTSNAHSSVCPWKGIASYYDVEVDGKVNRSAAWSYQDPSAAAKQIKGYIAFWGGVKIIKGDNESSEGILKRLRIAFS